MNHELLRNGLPKGHPFFENTHKNTATDRHSYEKGQSGIG